MINEDGFKTLNIAIAAYQGWNRSPEAKYSTDKIARRKYDGLLRESFLQMASITSRLLVTVTGVNTAMMMEVVIVTV